MTRARTSAALAVLVVGCARPPPQCPEPKPAPQPDSPMPMSGAEADLAAGRVAEAAATYREYLRAEPDGPERPRALFNLAGVHALGGSDLYDWKRALELYQELVTSFPTSHYAQRARMLLKLLTRIDSMQQEIDARRAEVGTLQAELTKLKSVDLQ